MNGLTMEEALAEIGLQPDVKQLPAEALYIHRSTPEGEVYFITNQGAGELTLSPAFRVTGMHPEWWDAVTGETRALPEYTVEGQHTVVPLTLAPAQSGFIVFKKSVGKKASGNQNFPAPEVLTTLEKPWTVTFDPAKRGPSGPVTFEKLTDWTASSDERIRAYSGTAVYTTTFEVSNIPANNALYLDLGAVNVMAKVKLNGVDLGTVWTAPYRVNVKNALKKGSNKLEVEVVNTWVNRLIGDSKLPESERKTWSNVNPYKPTDSYQPAGLAGPVALISVNY
jgi:hypothetical protein